MPSAHKTLEAKLADSEEYVRQKHLENAALKKALDAARRENEDLDYTIDRITGLFTADKPTPKWLAAPTAKQHGLIECPVTIWSDFHYGEVIKPEELNGVNQYNPDIAKARFQRLVDRTVDLCANHMGRKLAQFPGLVLCLGGDMITGNIHDELKNPECTIGEAIHEVTNMLASGIEFLQKTFGHLYIPCVVGNHGRSTVKPVFKGRVRTSYEYLIYRILEQRFHANRNIRFKIAKGADCYFEVYGHRHLLSHGDSLGVKGGDGIIGALGPILRGALKIHRSEAQIGRDFDTLIIGHWHQYISIPGIVVNGALMGLNEYGHLQLRAPNAPPSQALWFVHPRRGITARLEVMVEDRKNIADNSVWVAWHE